MFRSLRGQEFSGPGVQEARSSAGQEFRRPAVQGPRSSGAQESVMRRPCGCQESVRRPGGGPELTGCSGVKESSFRRSSSRRISSFSRARYSSLSSRASNGKAEPYFSSVRLGRRQILQEWRSSKNLPRGWKMTAHWRDILKGIKNVPEGWKMRNKEKGLQGFQKMSI